MNPPLYGPSVKRTLVYEETDKLIVEENLRKE